MRTASFKKEQDQKMQLQLLLKGSGAEYIGRQNGRNFCININTTCFDTSAFSRNTLL